jgi:hypothetical protein
MAETAATNKPDFRDGFPIRDLRDGGMIWRQADGEELVLGRRDDEFFAIGAHCARYGAPLAEAGKIWRLAVDITRSAADDLVNSGKEPSMQGQIGFRLEPRSSENLLSDGGEVLLDN